MKDQRRLPPRNPYDEPTWMRQNRASLILLLEAFPKSWRLKRNLIRSLLFMKGLSPFQQLRNVRCVISKWDESDLRYFVELKTYGPFEDSPTPPEPRREESR